MDICILPINNFKVILIQTEIILCECKAEAPCTNSPTYHETHQTSFFLILRSEFVPAFMPATGNIATGTCLASRPGQSGGTGSRAVALRQTPSTGISRPNHGKTTA